MEIESILDSIKQMLGIDYTDKSFDTEITIFINGALMAMSQLGAGQEGYFIQDRENLWSEFLGTRTDLEAVKAAVYLRVKLLFDPPQNSFLVTAIEKQITEYDWRIELAHKIYIPEVPNE